jgi:hypothetical protein
MHGQYTVAVCDVLGFSKLVQSHALPILVDHVLLWFRKSLYHSLHKNGFPENVPTLSEINTHPNVGVAWFSDTILLYTRHDTNDALSDLLTTVGWFILETMFERNARIRAGIAYGQAFIDPENSLYVGVPIIDAYQLEQKQEWMGGCLHDSAVERIPTDYRTGIYADWPVVPYHVPLKCGHTRETLAVNWTIGHYRPDSFPLWSTESDEPTETDWKKKEDICLKWKNARDFYNQIRRR